jgi:hypothetical protein
MRLKLPGPISTMASGGFNRGTQFYCARFVTVLRLPARAKQGACDLKTPVISRTFLETKSPALVFSLHNNFRALAWV